MTLVEIMITVAVLLFAMLGYSQAILHSFATNEATRENGMVGEGAREVLETLQNTQFDRVFALYNADPNDDPNGVGTAPGPHFAVPGLIPQTGDPDGMVGEIILPNNPAAPGALREDTVFAALGMPRDLNGDGVVDTANHSTDYRLLPVLVRVAWRGKAGNSQVEFRTMLGFYQ